MEDGVHDLPCRGCGATLERDARYCGRCGRAREPLDAMLIELSPLGGRSASPSAQTAVVSGRLSDRRRTLTIVGVVVVVALAALVVTKLVARSDGARSDAPAEPRRSTRSMIEPGAAAEPTTRDTAPDLSRFAPSTFTTLAPMAAPPTIPYVNQRRGEVLDAAQAGRSIYLSDGRTLVRIDLSTGLVTTRQLSSFEGGPPLTVAGERLVLLANGPGLTSLPADLSGEAVTLRGTDGFTNVMGAQAVDAGGAWLARYPSDATGSIALRRFDGSGRVLGQVALPMAAVVAGFVGEVVVVRAHGRIWILHLDGRLTPYAVGTVAAVGGEFILWLGCDDAARCSYHLGTPANADIGRTSLQTSFLLPRFGGEGAGLAGSRALSPDGMTLVAQVATSQVDGRPRVVDLATGSTLDSPGTKDPSAWTPDGQWLVEMTIGLDLVATNVRTGRAVPIAYPGLIDFRSSNRSIVVG